jgi:uncharacterized protein DUF6812
VDHRLTQIVAETERYRITGFLRLPPDGYRSRLSDYLNSPDRLFLPLTDVEVTPLDGVGNVERHKFLALGISHVVFALPVNEDDE